MFANIIEKIVAQIIRNNTNFILKTKTLKILNIFQLMKIVFI